MADWLDKSIDADDWGELAKYYQWCHENVSPMIRKLVEELDEKDQLIQSAKIGILTRAVFEESYGIK